MSAKQIADLVHSEYSDIGASVVSIGRFSLTVQLPADVVGASDLIVDIAALNGVVDMQKTVGGINLLITIANDAPLTKRSGGCSTLLALLFTTLALAVSYVLYIYALSSHRQTHTPFQYDL